ncbi:hypothetical protein [Sporisorium scitamineum]|uniref:Uncharacterized protein n=1 Tax=Sporisorium scitamineum TaxID=49012 RepID=A0A0F7SDB8_9BASI|nr:hypothetical protein [Sporisorium scitamineum]
MDMVRGNVGNNRVSDQRSGVSFNQSLRRSPPKGYASVDGVTALKEVSKYDSATEDCDTIVIHSVDSSCDFRTAASQSVTQKTIASRSHAVTVGHVHTYDGEGDQSVSRLTSTVEHEQAEVELVRKGSTSSTLSLSSISSRIRSLRRAVSVTNVTPAGSPSSRTGGEQRHVKKIRSRTFASAFGIELGILSGMKGRRDAPGSHVDSSPSTSAGTCPSSLMDLSFSPSPAAPRQTTKVFGNQQETPSPDNDVNDSMPLGAKKAHRRNLSRADSIMDMLDEEHGDTIEEMLNAVDVVSCTSREGEGCEEEAINAWNPAGKHDKSSFSEHFVADLDGEAVGFGEACEVDLADMTVHDAWERCFQRDDSMDSNDAMLAAKSEHEEVVPSARNDYDLMGFDTRRMIARAPFLDTVEEEPEEEQVAEASEEHQDGSTQERAGQDENSHQESRLDLVDAASNDVRDISSNSRWSSNIANPIDSITDGCGASRESLLLERESEQRRTTQLLMEHEVMFPHKTLSRIEEVTEVATTLRTSGYRTISAASANKLAGEKTASTADSGSIRLGLPLSLACQGGVERSGNDTPDSKSTVSVDKVEGDIREDQDEEHHLEERDQAQVDPSPRSRSERLGQLGMDQGIWMQSPVKLHLEESGAVVAAEGDISRDTNDVSSSFQMVDASIGVGTGRSIRLGRSLTLTRSRAALESKAVTMKKLVRLDHYDSPKRELRNRLARTSESLESHATGSSPQEKRLPHKPIKKRRKSRIKGVAVMIARHQFTVVDEDDSLIQRFNAAQPRGPSDNRATKTATVPQ